MNISGRVPKGTERRVRYPNEEASYKVSPKVVKELDSWQIVRGTFQKKERQTQVERVLGRPKGQYKCEAYSGSSIKASSFLFLF